MQLPPTECEDTEVVTNVPLPTVDADMRLFSFRLELDATPSNNVSLVFGYDANADGILSRAEESLLVGWDCGTWQAVDCATGEEALEPGALPPRFLFDPRWITLKVVCRGLDAPNAVINCSTENTPLVIRLRS